MLTYVQFNYEYVHNQLLALKFVVTDSLLEYL